MFFPWLMSSARSFLDWLPSQNRLYLYYFFSQCILGNVQGNVTWCVIDVIGSRSSIVYMWGCMSHQSMTHPSIVVCVMFVTHPYSMAYCQLCHVVYYWRHRVTFIHCVSVCEVWTLVDLRTLSYFGNSQSHEIHCVSVCEVWTLVDLRTLMTHPGGWLILCHVSVILGILEVTRSIVWVCARSEH